MMVFLLALFTWLVTAVRPAVNVKGSESSPPHTPPTDTGQAFAVGVTEHGRTDQAVKVTSWTAFVAEFGGRLNWTALAWDGVEAFFRFGGSVLYFSRVVGPAAVKAFVNIPDLAAGVSLIATALGEGDWYNGLNVIVETDPNNAAARRISITHDTDTSVNEVSPYYATQADLRDWALNSRYIRLTIGASALMPANAAGLNMATGIDDRAAITDVQRTAALNRFDIDLGPGQVCIPGATTATAWDAVLTHARDRLRVAILDYPDTPTEATLIALAVTARGKGRYGGGFGPWIRMPHVGGATKLIPPSLAIAGRISAQDAATNGWGQNKPAAGQRNGRGVLQGALDVSQLFADADARQRLNAAGVNLIRNRSGAITIYGWRSLADEVLDPGWTNLGHRRLQIALASKVDAVMEEFMFDEIDGQRHLLGKMNGQIKARAVDPYFGAGSLFGATPEEAYRIDTDSVNTPATIQNKELHATVTVVESEFAEEITVEIVKKQITEGV